MNFVHIFLLKVLLRNIGLLNVRLNQIKDPLQRPQFIKYFIYFQFSRNNDLVSQLYLETFVKLKSLVIGASGCPVILRWSIVPLSWVLVRITPLPS